MTKERSKQLRAGSKTYFFDIEATQEQGTPYLRITESRYKGDEDGSPVYDKQSIFIFAEHAEGFAHTVMEMLENLVVDDEYLDE